MAMGRAVCVKCNQQMGPVKNDFPILETYDDGRPYQIWLGDLYRCPECRGEIVMGFGLRPVAEDWRPDFESKLKSYNPTVRCGCPPSREALRGDENKAGTIDILSGTEMTLVEHVGKVIDIFEGKTKR